MELLISLFLLGLLIVINLIQLKFTTPGSDHYSHFAFINGVRKNNNRFLKSNPVYLNEGDISPTTPQLYYWIFSFVKRSWLDLNFRYIGFFINILSFLSFLVFLFLVKPYLSEIFSFYTFLITAGILFIFTPFQYYAWNAKNTGLSVRGFGVWMGQLVLYGIVLYILSDNIYFLFGTVPFYIVALLSSQFGHQFTLFFSIVASLLFLDWYIILIPILGIGLFFVLSFTRAKMFFVRQYGHKWMYANFIGPKFHMGYRYSIWRDFVYDFWIKLKQLGFIRGGEYIYRNPVIGSFLGFPVLLMVLLMFLFSFDSIELSQTAIVFLKLIFCGIILFIIFSFRATRFLGQPERYLEFFIPIMVLLPAELNKTEWIWAIMILSPIIIIFELIVIKILAKRDKGGISRSKINNDLLDTFQKTVASDPDVRLLANNTAILKYFTIDRYRVFNINITRPMTLGWHFKDIYSEKYHSISEPALKHFLKEAPINWFLLDTTLLPAKNFETDTSFCLEKKAEVHQYIIYKLC